MHASKRERSRRGGRVAPRAHAQLLEMLPAAAFLVDGQRRLTGWNEAMAALTGYGAAEVLGRRCDLLGGEALGCLTRGECLLLGAGGVGAAAQRRGELRCKHGGRVPVLKAARLLCDEGGAAVGCLELVTDLSAVLGAEATAASGNGERADSLLGGHPSMQRLFDAIELAAESSSPVLVQGEPGTGKELVARAVHAQSALGARPFVRVACAELTDRRLERELLLGRGDAEEGGRTVFLDEVGGLPLAAQTILLRLLQERDYERVGGSAAPRAELRLIAATHADLVAACERGAFKRELFYRLAAIAMHVPPLRERPSDLPLLVEAILARLNRRLGRDVAGVSPAAMKRLVAHTWPGNVRELEQALEHALARTRGHVISEAALPPVLLEATAALARGRRRPDAARIERALREAAGNRTRAARSLGVSRVTLWKWMRALGL